MVRRRRYIRRRVRPRRRAIYYPVYTQPKVVYVQQPTVKAAGLEMSTGMIIAALIVAGGLVVLATRR